MLGYVDKPRHFIINWPDDFGAGMPADALAAAHAALGDDSR